MPHTEDKLKLSNRERWRNVRGTARYRCAPATFGRVHVDSPEGDREFQHVWLTDLSRGGVGLVMLRPVPVGAGIQLSLRNPTTGQPVHLHGVVAHSTQQVSGDWLIGCQFATEISGDELDDLLA